MALLVLIALNIRAKRTVLRKLAYNGINAVAHHRPTTNVVRFRPVEEVHEQLAANATVAKVVGEAVGTIALERWLVTQLEEWQ